mgnify:CR=1 FL=1
MLVYEGTKTEFINDVNINKITDKIYDRYKLYFGRTTDSQINSWQNSLPLESVRIDFILSIQFIHESF